MIASWDEVKPGDVLKILDPLVPSHMARKRWIVVTRVVLGAAPDIAIVHGHRINANGRPNRRVRRDEWPVFLREVAEVIRK